MQLSAPANAGLDRRGVNAQPAPVNSLGKYSSYVYALMRIIVGLLFACHGAQKLLGWFGDPNQPPHALNTKMMVAGSIELVGGLLIAIGLLTMVAAFLASGLMAAAYFTVHAKGAFFPIVNHGESAVIYCWIFLYIFFRGAGPLSLDSLIFRGASAPDAVGGPSRTGQTY